MKILRDLWNGDIQPCEKMIWKDVRYIRIQTEYAEQTEDLHKQLTEKQQELLERSQSKYDELVWLQLEDAFLQGLRLGGQIMLAVLQK